MNIVRRSVSCWLGAVGCAWPALAIELSFQTEPQSIPVGGHATVSLVVSGLGSLSAPSLGAYLATANYDASILSAVAVVLGTHVTTDSLNQWSDLSVPGEGFVSEVSSDPTDDLDANQPGQFTLATFDFIGLAFGHSALDFDLTLTSLSDAAGNSLSFDTVAGSIQVVPEPGALAGVLTMISLAGAFVFFQRGKHPTPDRRKD